MSERPLIIGQFSGVGTGGSIALFTALQHDGAMQAPVSTETGKAEWSELLLT